MNLSEMLKLLSRRLVPQSQKLLFQQSAKLSSSAPEADDLPVTAPPNPHEHFDYFGVSKLFTVKTLFDSRMHLGHTVRSLQPQMSPFVFGTRLAFLTSKDSFKLFVFIPRFDMCVIDLDQTAVLLRQALNFTAQIAYMGGIVLFVCRQPSLIHMTDRAAQDCGEFSYTRWGGR